MTETVPSSENHATTTIYTFFNELGIINQLSGTAFRKALPDGMSAAQFGVLNHFARLQTERTPAALASAFQVTKGAMTNTLQRLEVQNFITITIDPTDKRRKFVMITEAGLQARAAALEAVRPVFAQLAVDMDIDGFEQAIPFLQTVRIYLDEHR